VAELLEYLPSNTDELPPPAPSATPCCGRRPNCAPSSQTAKRPPTTPGTWSGRWSTTANTGNCGRVGPDSWSPPLPVSADAGRFVANQPRIWRAPSTSRHHRRERASCGSVMRSICPSSAWSIHRVPAGKDLEWRGMIRHGAELAFAYAQATVPRLCLILRKAFGGAYIVMDSRASATTSAWPGRGRGAVMGAPAPSTSSTGGWKLGNGQTASWPTRTPISTLAGVGAGLVDEVVDPAESRIVLCGVLRQLCTKREFVVGRSMTLALNRGSAGRTRIVTIS